MAPSLDVQIRDLVALTQNLAEMTDTFASVKGFVAGTHIAYGNWPKAGHDAAHAYKKASSTAEDAADAVRGASDSTAKNLDAVARHYAGAEYHSSINPGSPPNLRHGAGYGSRTTAENLATVVVMPVAENVIAVALVARLWRTRELVKLTARPTGLLPAFLVIDALFIEPNIRESGPFRAARDTWRAIADSNLQPLCEKLGRIVPIRTWDGDAAASFNAHMDARFLPALNELKSLAGSMGDLCDEMAAGMDKINGLWLRMLIEMTFQLLLINLAPLPFRPIFSYAALVLFTFNVSYIYAKMSARFSEMAATMAKLEGQAGTLASDCFGDSQTLDDKRNLLNPRFTMVSDNWSSDDWAQNWHYKAAP
jgi:hypothetical protein